MASGSSQVQTLTATPAACARSTRSWSTAWHHRVERLVAAGHDDLDGVRAAARHEPGGGDGRRRDLLEAVDAGQVEGRHHDPVRCRLGPSTTAATSSASARSGSKPGSSGSFLISMLTAMPAQASSAASRSGTAAGSVVRAASRPPPGRRPGGRRGGRRAGRRPTDGRRARPCRRPSRRLGGRRPACSRAPPATRRGGR